MKDGPLKGAIFRRAAGAEIMSIRMGKGLNRKGSTSRIRPPSSFWACKVQTPPPAMPLFVAIQFVASD